MTASKSEPTLGFISYLQLGSILTNLDLDKVALLTTPSIILLINLHTGETCPYIQFDHGDMILSDFIELTLIFHKESFIDVPAILKNKTYLSHKMILNVPRPREVMHIFCFKWFICRISQIKSAFVNELNKCILSKISVLFEGFLG